MQTMHFKWSLLLLLYYLSDNAYLMAFELGRRRCQLKNVPESALLIQFKLDQ